MSEKIISDEFIKQVSSLGKGTKGELYYMLNSTVQQIIGRKLDTPEEVENHIHTLLWMIGCEEKNKKEKEENE